LFDATMTGFLDTNTFISVYNDSTMLKVNKHEISSSEESMSLRYDGDDSSMVVFNDGNLDGMFDIVKISGIINQEIKMGCLDLSIAAGDSCRLSINNESGIVISNFGKETNYDLSFEIVGAVGDTIFMSYDIGLSQNSSHIINPIISGIWYDTLQIYVDSSSDGTIDDTILAENQYVGDFICGDANGDGKVDLLDILFLISYKFKGGPAPDPLLSGDADWDGKVDLLDKGGSAPNCP
jgi:hypothetical protein